MKSGSRTYFAALDGVRAFSVLFVVFHHIGQKPAWMNHIHGWLGVDIFFVLSGFLITYLLEQEKHNIGRVNLSAFYVRRAFRILPVYSVVLAVYVLIARFSGHAEKWQQLRHNLPYFLTFCNEFALKPDRHTVFDFSWTLGVEEKFYIVWPFVFFVALASTKWRPYILAFLYLGLLAVAPFLMETARSYSALMVGCFLALALTNARTMPLRDALSRIPAAVPLVLLLIGFYLVDLGRGLVFLFSWIVFFLLGHLLLAESWLRRFLSRPALSWLGKLSYGMYLMHGLCLDVVQPRIQSRTPVGVLIVVIATFGLSALAAYLMFRMVESPVRDYGKRLLARPKRVEAEPVRGSMLAEIPSVVPADGLG